ncbi:MAG: hypothetical protein SGARI_002633 [Bacillariaceae sp.]
MIVDSWYGWLFRKKESVVETAASEQGKVTAASEEDKAAVVVPKETKIDERRNSEETKIVEGLKSEEDKAAVAATEEIKIVDERRKSEEDDDDDEVKSVVSIDAFHGGPLVTPQRKRFFGRVAARVAQNFPGMARFKQNFDPRGGPKNMNPALVSHLLKKMIPDFDKNYGDSWSAMGIDGLGVLRGKATYKKLDEAGFPVEISRQIVNCLQLSILVNEAIVSGFGLMAPEVARGTQRFMHQTQSRV